MGLWGGGGYWFLRVVMGWKVGWAQGVVGRGMRSDVGKVWERVRCWRGGKLTVGGNDGVWVDFDMKKLERRFEGFDIFHSDGPG